MAAVAFLLATASVSATKSDDVNYVTLGKFSVNNAAFLKMEQFEDSEPFLLVSSFGAFIGGQIYVVPDVAAAVSNANPSTLRPVNLSVPDLLWPNSVATIPQDVFVGQRAIVVPDGFLPPGKGNGGVYVVLMDPTNITKAVGKVTLTKNKKGFFYHMGVWVDLNGDGRKDFLTAKTNAQPGKGQLVWLENPEGGLQVSPWNEHIICSGPDVNFDVEKFSEYPDEIMVFAAQFFDQEFGLYRISTKDGSLIDSRIIDNNTLHAYSVSLADLDSDGKKELLLNNHEKDEKVNGIWAYSIPIDLMGGDFAKYTLSTGFKNAPSFPVPNTAPGFTYAVWPQISSQGQGRAYILVAGDGDHSVSMLDPIGDKENFQYNRTLIENTGGTVGALAFSDLDCNGWLEMWVPNYDGSTIELFKFIGSSSS